MEKINLSKDYVIEDDIVRKHSTLKIYSTFMESYNKELNKSKKEINKVLSRYDISYIFIGGIARNEYTSPRTTEDIDILVAKEDMKKVKDISIGYMRDITGNGKMFNFHNNDNKVKLEILYSGEYAGDPRGIEYLDPDIISEMHQDGLKYITLKDLIRYKLSAGIYGNRYKDFGDIQDLIKTNKLSFNYANKFREDLKEKYQQIWKETELQ